MGAFSVVLKRYRADVLPVARVGGWGVVLVTFVMVVAGLMPRRNEPEELEEK